MERIDISRALYQFAADVGGPALVKRVGLRSRKALEGMLQTAPDIESPPDKFAIEMMFAAMAGATRHVSSPSAADDGSESQRHLVVLCQSYMRPSCQSSLKTAALAHVLANVETVLTRQSRIESRAW